MAVSDKDIYDYVVANLGNPQAIADAAKEYNVSAVDLSRATGQDLNVVNSYFSNANITQKLFIHCSNQYLQHITLQRRVCCKSQCFDLTTTDFRVRHKIYKNFAPVLPFISNCKMAVIARLSCVIAVFHQFLIDFFKGGFVVALWD